MPYVSDAQRKYFNANKDRIGSKVVNEFNESSKDLKLPEYAPKIKELAYKHARIRRSKI